MSLHRLDAMLAVVPSNCDSETEESTTHPLGNGIELVVSPAPGGRWRVTLGGAELASGTDRARVEHVAQTILRRGVAALGRKQ